MIDKSKPYGEVIAAQQAEHGKRVMARKAVNGQPLKDAAEKLGIPEAVIADLIDIKAA